MTLYKYKMHSEDEQYDTVFAKGKFLGYSNRFETFLDNSLP